MQSAESIKKFADTRFGQAIIIVSVCMIIYLLITYVYVYDAHSSDYDDFIFGYWVADDGFCEESEIDSMLLFIGKPKKTGGGLFSNSTVTRPAHMVIGDDIMNQKITMKYSTPHSGFARRVCKYSVKTKLEFEDECQIPNDVVMDFDIKKGCLRIHDNENLYALMYKDHEITEQFVAKDEASDKKNSGSEKKSGEAE